jgi:hypothetical protein
LEPGDKKHFEKHIDGIINQMEAFDKLSLENSVDLSASTEIKLIEEGKAAGTDVVQNKRDFTSLEKLFEDLKEKAFNTNNYERLLTVFQVINNFPINEKGMDMWESLEEFMSKLSGGEATLGKDYSNG